MSDKVDTSPEETGFAANEYEREPVPENKTKGLGSFLGLFASEHVAATELLIGPLFVAAGVSAFDVLVGLLIGNFLAVLSWTFLTAPIAVKKRLTLYFQLEKIGGPGIIVIYNAANGVLWCCLAAAFIYVSATALFVPLNLPIPQLTDWGPNSVGMVAVIVAMGAVIAVVAAKGYDAVARFANIAAPWMVVMFLAFGIAALPELGVRSLGDFWRVANEVWDGKAAEGHVQFTFWHVVCFAWFGNMAWHLGMGDLSIFRYARKARYGLASAAGMYLGHYVAWITAGLLYAVQLSHDPTDTSVVPGPMAYRVAGVSGILLVLFAGWTTANPVIYRAGLAFQSIYPKWSRVRVTLVAGAVASVIAVFPGLCNNFLSVAMLYGLILMPMGAVIFADHYLMKRMGMAEFYAERRGLYVYWPPVIAWVLSLLICVGLWRFAGIQEFFLCLPGWLLSGVIYVVASKLMQSNAKYTGEEA
jgi:purine-cytosine permease-like protein